MRWSYLWDEILILSEYSSTCLTSVFKSVGRCSSSLSKSCKLVFCLPDFFSFLKNGGRRNKNLLICQKTLIPRLNV